MESILNEQMKGPQGENLRSFKHGFSTKTLLSAGTELYRVVTKENLAKGIEGTRFIEGAFWFDRFTYDEISSRVNYDSYLCSITELSRSGLAITTNFSALAEALISISLKADVYGWMGKAARQEEYLKNGIRVVLPGNLNQLWIPNLSSRLASLRFFHSI